MKFSFETDLGYVTVGEHEGKIDEVRFYDCKEYESNPLLEKAKLQIAEYLDGTRKIFDLPVQLHGTPFQLKIWEYLLTIPYGCTASYKQAAEYAGCPKGARAAGGAIGSNPVSIIVPCHRVIGSNGKLVGYEYGTDIKRKLLEIEKNAL